jgi:ABC-2 type transport system ATP-binding protein
MNPIAMSVTVNDLCRRFGSFVAVDHINLQVKKGEIFGFLGPNGSGKSTTIRMLCGLLMPTSGSGTVGGYDILKQSEQIKRTIGYMSQKFSLYDDLTVEENINFFGGVYGVPARTLKERKDWVLAMAGIQDKHNALTMTLAGGFKQRLALGCAILHEPPIIFLDEPTSGVDPISRRNFWSLIHDMAAQGITIFVTTHYMDEADYCDRLGLIYRGKIIAEGTPNELKHTFMARDVVEIVVDQLMPAISCLHQQHIEAAIFGSALHATVDKASLMMPQIQAMLDQAGILVQRIEKIVPSLEDVFVTLIEEA